MGTDTVQEQLVDVGDRQLHVTITGSGPGLVWLHGGGPGASGMSNFQANLDAFGDFTNLVFDFPRYGKSSREPVEEEIIGHATERIIRALDQLGFDKVSPIGNSLGGGVAGRMAAEHPDRVDKLVLMAPAGGMPDDMKLPDDLPIGLKHLFGYFAQGPDRDRMREFCKIMVHDQSMVTDELVEARFAASDREPEMDMSSGPPKLGDNKPLLGKIKAQTLCIWGREDNFLPVEWALTFLNGIDDCRLIVEPHSGHWVQYERREAFNTFVGDFLRGN
jgi:4,5:9,10-diseco-3-hydroxy-5,9,17-trioxoandrosta-1(10),2-diene-4-oate hydrolase